MSDDDLGARADEQALLTGFLDWYRSVVERKVAGLTRAHATRVMTPSGLSPLGIVQHLAWVERSWFRFRFAGEEVEVTGGEGSDNAPQFHIEAGTTVDSIVGFYRDECERSRRITAATPSLDTESVRAHRVWGLVTLRWILVHMLEETARHAGHLDLMREHIDGVTGD